MDISLDQVLSTIDETIQDTKEDIAYHQSRREMHEDTILALESLVKDYQSLRYFILTKDRQKHTSWVQVVIADANLLKKKQKLLGTYSPKMLTIVLPYLTTFYKD